MNEFVDVAKIYIKPWVMDLHDVVCWVKDDKRIDYVGADRCVNILHLILSIAFNIRIVKKFLCYLIRKDLTISIVRPIGVVANHFKRFPRIAFSGRLCTRIGGCL